MAFKKIRNMKVYEQSGYRYKSTPTIMLKGQWLNELGFGYGTPICVECKAGSWSSQERMKSRRHLQRFRYSVWLRVVQSMEGGMRNGQDHHVWFI